MPIEIEFEAAVAVVIGSGLAETMRIAWGQAENVKPAVWYARRLANFAAGCLIGAYAPQVVESRYPDTSKYHELLAAGCAFFGSTVLHLCLALATGPVFVRIALLSLRAVSPGWLSKFLPDPTDSGVTKLLTPLAAPPTPSGTTVPVSVQASGTDSAPSAGKPPEPVKDEKKP